MSPTEDEMRRAAEELDHKYRDFMISLGRVASYGESIAELLTSRLTTKHSNAAAVAIGELLPSECVARVALPNLIEWAVGQSPMTSDARNAIVRVGEGAYSAVESRISVARDEQDDEAIRNLCDIIIRFPSSAKVRFMPALLDLLNHENPHFREAAIDAIAEIAFSESRSAIEGISRVAMDDVEAFVRDAAKAALLRLGQAT